MLDEYLQQYRQAAGALNAIRQGWISGYTLDEIRALRSEAQRAHDAALREIQARAEHYGIAGVRAHCADMLNGRDPTGGMIELDTQLEALARQVADCELDADPPLADERPEDTGMDKDDYLELMERGAIDPADPAADLPSDR